MTLVGNKFRADITVVRVGDSLVSPRLNVINQESDRAISAATDDDFAIVASNDSSDSTIFAQNFGTGSPIYAFVRQVSSTAAAIQAWASEGNGLAAFNQSSSKPALYAENLGGGSAAWFVKSQNEVVEIVSQGIGIAAWNDNGSAPALYAHNFSGGLAAIFQGGVNIFGTLTKSSGAFRIDHPLDPENKYLYHSFVESPDMMNIYNGNVILDENGKAWVEMPNWFEALNIEYRYQLTPIGTPGPNLYVAKEVSDNRFKIAGGQAGMEVSWQITGIRNDTFARENRIPVEQDKPVEERGTLLDSSLYRKPSSSGIDYQKLEPQPHNAETVPQVPDTKNEQSEGER